MSKSLLEKRLKDTIFFAIAHPRLGLISDRAFLGLAGLAVARSLPAEAICCQGPFGSGQCSASECSGSNCTSDAFATCRNITNFCPGGSPCWSGVGVCDDVGNYSTGGCSGTCCDCECDSGTGVYYCYCYA